MKKSELKEIIKTAFLAEADELNEKYDDVKEQEDVEVEDNVDVKDTENVDVDVEKDVDVDDVSKESDIEVKSEIPGESSDVAAILGLLTKAQEKSEELGDEKLLDQIGNTITYYTRAHVVKSGDVMEEMKDKDVDEAMRGPVDIDEKDEDVKEAMRGPVDIDEKEKEDVKEELTEEVKRFKKLAGLI
jgi:hypothetical protein|tara:strand:- start:156 stop:716 length:561 start_codon:yes stop_codon:yes gene_type:complete